MTDLLVRLSSDIKWLGTGKIGHVPCMLPTKSKSLRNVNSNMSVLGFCMVAYISLIYICVFRVYFWMGKDNVDFVSFNR